MISAACSEWICFATNRKPKHRRKGSGDVFSMQIVAMLWGHTKVTVNRVIPVSDRLLFIYG
jgi:hypothetical protein